ncbi:heat-shock protein [Prevotella sp. P5-108]|jgi:HSP20 family protein|uniref:Hsp20/alpha crystallin family protein n=1 Tax=unclassified Prevotella TaxID=2638335 RepID=UPI000B963790|nr:MULTISPECIES: Hsp20/alpha crystallin family protein [unclassified Prevotella]OYP65967.1 heat-shock protein [Prevotella sp. P5-108]OYP70291.1 heat-shock protein [Prevotella sp. P4-67]
MLLVRRNNDFDWLNNWFDDNFFNTPVMAQTTTTAPAVNVKEDNKQYVMEVAVPGLKKEQVNMSIDKDGYLTLSIENKNEQKDENKKEHYLRREFSYTSYRQSYALPDNVNADKIEANVADGVLKVVLPKVEKKEEKEDVKHIEVK